MSYYGAETYKDENNNARYNKEILQDWDTHFEKAIPLKSLEYLLLRASYNGVDSVYKNYLGTIKTIPDTLPNLKTLQVSKKQLTAFMDYLLLAKSCESFAASYQPYYWGDEKPAVTVPAQLEGQLNTAFKNTKDTFVKQRLWFQLVRYYYFLERADQQPVSGSKTLKAFDTSKDSFPKNSMYYRTLGYLAGLYYSKKEYATSNYLNSLCYDYSYQAKIPAKWSFHPQEESDWKQTLDMAKTKEEKITLWQLLGIYYDAERAITEIIALDPKSEKLDLLLSRVVNSTESGINDIYGYRPTDTLAKKELQKTVTLIGGIAQKNITSKPYYWNLAAGYLYSLNGDYQLAKRCYDLAKGQLPQEDQLVMAQYKLLDWSLYVKQLKTIDVAAETKLVEPLNWFADLRENKTKVPDLRFYQAVDQTIDILSALYKKMGNPLKANAFKSYSDFYRNNQQIEQLKALLGKPNKTAFEKAMLRYYPHKAEDLIHYQALVLVYQDKLPEAIAMMAKGNGENTPLLGNPFNIRINDCHDCDHQMAQSTKFTAGKLLRMMNNLSTEIKAGRNAHNNAYLLANAFYNITYYGNGRTFYFSPVTEADVSYPTGIPKAFRNMTLSCKLAEKYYQIARDAATTDEQRARCTFMASKCERNESYTLAYNRPENANYWNSDIPEKVFGRYFAALKQQYSNTRFYKEILQECGYFSSFNAR